MKLKILLLSFLTVFLMAGTAFALELGANITIYDGAGSGSDWYGHQEDREVEPGMQTDQVWDLEGFFLNGTTLTMVGGYDFVNGQGGWDPGDLFIDVDGIIGSTYIQPSDGNKIVNDNFGYEYVLVGYESDPGSYKYNVYELNSLSAVKTVYFKQNNLSSPWIYNGEWDEDADEYVLPTPSFCGGVITYIPGLSDTDVGGLEGGTHNAIAVDLGFLGDDINNFISHYTMQCGNDNLMGSVPEPSTMLLFGTGFLGLAMIGRKKLFRKS